jgi:hypothetical protein
VKPLPKMIEIVGPCSKYIDGKGWTIRVKLSTIIEILEKEGYTVTKENDNGKTNDDNF